MRFPLRRNGTSGTISVLPLPEEAGAGDAPVVPETPAPEPVSRPEAPPMLPFGMPLKGQFTAADSRADRLIRKIRGEVEGIRNTLEQLSLESAEMMEVDIAAVMADPETATTLPPAALVRALVALGERNEDLERELSTTRSKATKLRSANPRHAARRCGDPRSPRNARRSDRRVARKPRRPPRRAGLQPSPRSAGGAATAARPV